MFMTNQFLYKRWFYAFTSITGCSIELSEYFLNVGIIHFMWGIMRKKIVMRFLHSQE